MDSNVTLLIVTVRVGLVVYAIVDLETTGKDPWRNEILQIGTILADEKLQAYAEYDEYIRPEWEESWDEGSEQIHGISWEKSRAFKTNVDIARSYIRFLGSHRPLSGYKFVCHAFPFKSSVDLFDRNFIFAFFWRHNLRSEYYKFFPEEKMLSTIDRNYVKATKQWDIENQKLGTWAKKLRIKFKHHSALEDARVCLEILKFKRRNELWHDQPEQQHKKPNSQHLKMF